MKRTLTATVLLLALVSCLDREIDQTLYLERDGTATWLLTVTHHPEDDVEKMAREREHILEETTDLHQILDEAGAFVMETTILRHESPMRYQISGRFDGIDRILDILLEDTDTTHDLVPDGEGLLLIFEVPESEMDKEMYPLELIVVGGEHYILDRLGELVDLAIPFPRD